VDWINLAQDAWNENNNLDFPETLLNEDPIVTHNFLSD
jgi:hypothetical protein